MGIFNINSVKLKNMVKNVTGNYKVNINEVSNVNGNNYDNSSSNYNSNSNVETMDLSLHEDSSINSNPPSTDVNINPTSSSNDSNINNIGSSSDSLNNSQSPMSNFSPSNNFSSANSTGDSSSVTGPSSGVNSSNGTGVNSNLSSTNFGSDNLSGNTSHNATGTFGNNTSFGSNASSDGIDTNSFTTPVGDRVKVDTGSILIDKDVNLSSGNSIDHSFDRVENTSFDFSSLEQINNSIDVVTCIYENLLKEISSYSKVFELLNQQTEHKTVNVNGKTSYSLLEQYLDAKARNLDTYSSIKNYVDRIISVNTDFSSYEEFIEYYNQLELYSEQLNASLYNLHVMEREQPYIELRNSDEFKKFIVPNEKIDLSISEESITISIGNVTTKMVNYSNDINPVQFILEANKIGNVLINGINNETEIRNLIKASENDPELLKIYEYLYYKEGIDSANKYLSDMQNRVNQIVGQMNAEEFINGLDEIDSNVVSQYINNHIIVHGKGLADGLVNFFSGISAWGEQNPTYSVKDYESMYIMKTLQENEDLYGKFLTGNYELGQGVGNMIPSVVLSSILSPGVGMTMLGVSAGGNSYKNSRLEGYSELQSIIYGLMSGASEAIFERYLGGLPGLSEVNVSSIGGLLKSMAKEGLEEVYQDGMDFITRGVIFHDWPDNITLDDIREVIGNEFKTWYMGALTAGEMNMGAISINSFKKLSNLVDSNSAETIADYEDCIIKQIQNDSLEISKQLNVTPLNIMNGFFLSMTSGFIGNFLYKPLNAEISNKVLSEGLYHFTSLETANLILNSGFIKESGVLTSYGNKKSFFFAGVPTIQDYSANCISTNSITKFDGKAVAIKLDVNSDDIKDFKFRGFSDQAVSFDGRYYLKESNNARIAYMAMVEGEDGSLSWQEMSKEEWENYRMPSVNNAISSMKMYFDVFLLGICSQNDNWQRFKANIKELLSRKDTNIDISYDDSDTSYDDSDTSDDDSDTSDDNSETDDIVAEEVIKDEEEKIMKWVDIIVNNEFNRYVDGINFISDSEERLNELIDYYKKALSVNDNPFVEYYINKLLSSNPFRYKNGSDIKYSDGLNITNIPLEGHTSFQYDNIVCFHDDEINNERLSVFFHETGHFFDSFIDKSIIQDDFIEYIKTVREQISRKEAINIINKYHDDYKALKNNYFDYLNSDEDSINMRTDFLRKNYHSFDSFSDDIKDKLITDFNEDAFSNLCFKNGMAAVSDILQALFYKTAKSTLLLPFGHYRDFESDVVAYKEIVANISDLYTSSNVNVLKKYLGNEIVLSLEDFYEKIIEIASNNKLLSEYSKIYDDGYGQYSFIKSLLSYICPDDSYYLNSHVFGDFSTDLSGWKDSEFKVFLVKPINAFNVLNYISGVLGEQSKTIFSELLNNGSAKGLKLDPPIEYYLDLLLKTENGKEIIDIFLKV